MMREITVSEALHAAAAPVWEKCLAHPFVTGLGDEHFRVGPCKFMIDGGSGGPTCYTREPYSHNPDAPSERGWEREETWEYIKKVDEMCAKKEKELMEI